MLKLRRSNALKAGVLLGIWCCITSFFSIKVSGQSAQEVFGKNRIQYKSFEWKYLSTNSIDLYYYEGGETFARTAIEIGEAEFKRISDLFGSTPISKIKIFLYLSTNDRLMSNVGLGDNSVVTGGKTSFTKSITEIAYEGDLGNIRKQISAGIAQILIRDMLFGGSFKDAVQNSYLLTLPDWFIGGAIRYASEGWNSDLDDFVRDINFSRRMRQPANYVGKDAFAIGHSIWNYVAERYGRSNVGNILNLTRIIRNEENAISGTLGMPFQTFLRDWKNFYQAQNQINESFLNYPPKNQRISKNVIKKNYRQLALSQDGEYLVFAQNWKGKFQVVSHHIKTRKSHVIFRGGSKAIHQNAEGEYPIVTFDHRNTLWIAYPHKGIWNGIKMDCNGANRSKLQIFKGFHEVYGMDVSKDGKQLVISASLDGFSDIFLISTTNYKSVRITNDWFDDLDPVFTTTGDSILFTSNRFKPDTSKPLDKQIPDGRRKSSLYSIAPHVGALPQLWYDGGANLTRPQMVEPGTVVCLSDEAGVSNLIQIRKVNEGMQHKFVTSSKFSIRDYAYRSDHKLLAYTIQIRLRPGLYLDQNFEEVPVSIPLNNKTEQSSGFDSTLTSAQIQKAKTIWSDSGRIDIRNYVFEEEKLPPTPANMAAQTARQKRQERLKLRKEAKSANLEIQGPMIYTPRATANYLTTGLVVDPIPSWGLGALIDFSMHDMFENHRINGGMTYFFSDIEMRNNVAFLEYQYLKHRVDFKARVDRKSIQNSSVVQAIRQRDILYGASITASFPFSNALRAEFSPYFQSTKRSVFDNNPGSPALGGEDVDIFYGGVKGELVFDNTTTTGMNMMTGTRIKVRSQYQIANKHASRAFGELYADLRTYQPIHKEIIFAFRATYGSFFGPDPKKYSLGGMDNWLFRSYEATDQKDDPLRGLNQNSQIIASDEAQSDWLFNRYVTNLRGFKYNDIYGTSFLLFNWELRVPIIRYVYKGPINSNFWRNLQLTAFTDMGTAWTGDGPFKKDNSLNTKQIDEGNFTIKVKTFDNPFLTGYGFGARTMVLGYYLKFDMAWGRRNGITNEPRYYFTFGYDF